MKSKIIYRNYLHIMIFTAMFILFIIGLFNFIMDPLWNFSHSHALNNLQKGFDERQQKINKIQHQPFMYNALLLGSSRAVLLDQNKLNSKGVSVFNFATSLSMPQEYRDYVNFAKKKQNNEFKYLFLELDFYGTNKNNKRLINYTGANEINVTKECCYRWKTLFSFSTLKYSLNNLVRAVLRKASHRSYRRDNVALTDKYTEEEVKHNVEKITLDKAVGMENYIYNDGYKDVLETLKSENNQTTLIVFTSPVSSHYLDLLFEAGLWDDYARWLHDIVSVFGEVYHFMDYNTVTKEYTRYFLDYHHVYPKVQGMMASKILGKSDDNIPRDFGELLNGKNLDPYLKIMKQMVENQQRHSLSISNK